MAHQSAPLAQWFRIAMATTLTGIRRPHAEQLGDNIDAGYCIDAPDMLPRGFSSDVDAKPEHISGSRTGPNPWEWREQWRATLYTTDRSTDHA